MSSPDTATPPNEMPAAVNAEMRLMQYRAAREAVMAQFVRTNRVQSLWRGLTHATDALLAQVAGEDASAITVIAVGGYGRGELFPFSDVDVVLLIAPDADVASAEKTIAPLLQHLWDMQIPVSHASRTVEHTIDAATDEHTIASALMDARFIAGDRQLFRTMKKRLRQEVVGSQTPAFIRAKLQERDQRHTRWGDSRFMLEPNVKEGKGGLRDLHTLAWLARYGDRSHGLHALAKNSLLSAQEWRDYRQAYLFFATVRAHLHILRGRAEERLTFDAQLQLAARLHFRGHTPQQKAERFMRRYFQFTRQVGSLTRIFLAVLEETQGFMPPRVQETLEQKINLPEGFILQENRLAFAPSHPLVDHPSHSVILFQLAQYYGWTIHPHALLEVTRALPSLVRKLPFEGAANQAFLTILLTPDRLDTTLRRMNEMGVLGALIPEFDRVTGMMQYDGYHTYTVDEHTLVAVGNLAMIESGAWGQDMPTATAVAPEVEDRAPLYVAMLCHDLAKGMGGAHADKGEAVVLPIALRLGLDAEQAGLAAWLVKHHLRLSETAFKRDLDDPQTIEDFVAIVQSPERLRLLLLVTVADIKAVGPTIWNGWKGSLMRTLYHRAMLHIGAGGNDAVPQHRIHAELMETIPPALQDSAGDFMAQHPPGSWWYRPRVERTATIQAYAAWKLAPEKAAMVVRHDGFQAVSDVTFCLGQRPGFFCTLAGAMAWIGASIVSARIMVLADKAAVATLGIQDVQGHSFVHEQDRLTVLPALIEKGLRGALEFTRELPRRRTISTGREVVIEPVVTIDNAVSAQATVVEIHARDRLGLLYDILGVFETCRLQVVTAHIATYGQKAVDVFYVKDAYGIKMRHAARLEEMQQALLAACRQEGVGE